MAGTISLISDGRRTRKLGRVKWFEYSDHGGTLDNYKPFIETLRKKGKLLHKYPQIKLNVTNSRPSLENIGHPTIEIIEEANQLDIALYRRLKARYTIL